MGTSGNTNTSTTAFTTVSYSSSPLTGLPSGMVRTPPNPELRWEQIRTINVGIDFKSFDNRVSGSIDLFSKNGRDQLGDIPLDPTSGYFLSNRYSYLRKGASFRGNGMDFALNT